MPLRNYILVFGILLLCSLLEQGIFPFLAIHGALPNAVFITLFVVLFWYRGGHLPGDVFFIITGAFFLDIFSSLPLGFSLLPLVAIYAMVKTATYFLQDLRGPLAVIYFLLVFVAGFVLYRLASMALAGYAIFTAALAVEVLYNVVIAAIAFYVYGYIYHLATRGKQLSLFNY